MSSCFLFVSTGLRKRNDAKFRELSLKCIGRPNCLATLQREFLNKGQFLLHHSVPSCIKTILLDDSSRICCINNLKFRETDKSLPSRSRDTERRQRGGEADGEPLCGATTEDGGARGADEGDCRQIPKFDSNFGQTL